MPTGDAAKRGMRARHGVQRGFTYLMLLWWVAISGVMLMALAQNWQADARREKEAELAFRGAQIRAAIEAYARVPVARNRSRLPARLDDLLEDRRGIGTVRHLRRLWGDPVTGGDWALIRDEGGGIRGVYSAAEGTPMRAPPGVSFYSEWRFEADLSAIGAASSPSADLQTGMPP